MLIITLKLYYPFTSWSGVSIVLLCGDTLSMVKFVRVVSFSYAWREVRLGGLESTTTSSELEEQMEHKTTGINTCIM